MENHLEQAIRDLKAAEDRIEAAAAALEREVNRMTINDEDGRLRHKDIVDSIERCHIELARKVRLRRRFLVSVRDGYSYGKAS